MSECTVPTDVYTIDCTGDVVVGDRVRFDEAVFGGSHRRPRFRGLRTVEAEIIGDSYGEQMQQHTFSIFVLASSGFDALRPSERIRRKGRNVYRRGVWRAAWADEDARLKVAEGKHARGEFARAAREIRRNGLEPSERF